MRVLRDDAIARALEDEGAALLETVLQPGDALYVPPGCLHDGTNVSNEDGYTYSIGLLAPAASDLLLSFAAFANDQPRFTNTDDGAQRRWNIACAVADAEEAAPTDGEACTHGTVGKAHVRAAQAWLRSLADDDALVHAWLGTHFTGSGVPTEPQMVDGRPMIRSPGTKMLYVQCTEGNGTLYANGEPFAVRSRAAEEWARQLADSGVAPLDHAGDAETSELADTLAAVGAVCPSDDAERLALAREETWGGGEDAEGGMMATVWTSESANGAWSNAGWGEEGVPWRE